jgi:hypothetical protein
MRGLQQEGVEYRQLVGRFSNVVVPGAVPSGASCPKDVDWYEVAAGLWPDATKESASTKSKLPRDLLMSSEANYLDLEGLC